MKLGYPVALLSLFATAGCFSPNAAAETDGAEEAGTSAGTTGPTGTEPTTGADPATGTASTTGTETTSGTNPSDSDPTVAPTDTDPSDTDPSDSDPSDSDPSDSDPSDSDPSDSDPTGTDTGGGTVCGDGAVEGDEVCDDGVNDGSYDGCESDCSAFGPFCGDGTEDGAEECDDGDETQGNGCNNDCVPSGLELWTHEEHQTANDACVAVVPSDSDHIYLAAQIENLDGGEFAGSFFAQRLSANGTVDWEREHAPLASSTQHDYLTYEAAHAGDGVVLAGAHRLSATQNPVLTGYSDVHTVKLSAANGDVVWSRNDDGPAFPVGVAADDEGEFAIAAFAGNSFDSYIFRVSAAGNAVGEPDITIDGDVSAIAFDPAGSFLVAMSPSAPVIQRRNEGFGVLWEADVSPLSDVLALTAGEAGDIFATGGGWIGRRASGNGAEVWTVLSNDVAALGSSVSIAVTPEGDIVVAGARQGAPWVARLDPQGEVRWSRSVGEDGSFASVGVRTDGSIVACGTIDGGGQGENIFVAAYTP